MNNKFCGYLFTGNVWQGFSHFARSRNREFQVNLQNPAKFETTREIQRNLPEILLNTCTSRHNIFEGYLGCTCWGCLLAVNMLIYFETSLLQRENNIPKLPGVLMGCANRQTFVADTKCFSTKSETFYVSRTQNLCPRANGDTFASATMCPQQCVLVCQGL